LKKVLFLPFVLFVVLAPAADRTKKKPSGDTGPKPTYEDHKYGKYDRNVIDFWRADSKRPTPVVVYIHGGGFIKGDKSGVRGGRNGAWLKRALQNGVSFAAINYRLRNVVTLDIILTDIARAIQYLRYKAKDWFIDKKRIAAFGGSAGGGSSLWLAVHDDLADRKNKDPVLRESSRLAAAGLLNFQATYDIEKWAEIVKVGKN